MNICTFSTLFYSVVTIVLLWKLKWTVCSGWRGVLWLRLPLLGGLVERPAVVVMPRFCVALCSHIAYIRLLLYFAADLRSALT